MLYRYIFRGIGVLLVIGMITALVLAIASVRSEKTAGHTHPAQTRAREAK